MQKIISILLVFFILISSINFSFAIKSSCEYQKEIDKCIQGQGDSKYICLQSGNRGLNIFNLILDIKFTEIDEEADEYLEELQREKSKFFGLSQEKTFLDGIEEIENKFGEFGEFEEKYWATLDIFRIPSKKGILAQTMDCNDGKLELDLTKMISIVRDLIKKKLNIRRSVAFDILKLNKIKMGKDQKKRYMQQRRVKYDVVSELFMVNIGYFLRIMQKWSSKTPR